MTRRTFFCLGLVVLVAVGCTHPRSARVSPATLEGKVLCGYQGWFNGEGDGAGRG